MELDEVDRRIVELLVEDGRRSVNDIAERANTSRASAYRRLDRLREAGAIRGVHAVRAVHDARHQRQQRPRRVAGHARDAAAVR